MATWASMMNIVLQLLVPIAHAQSIVTDGIAGCDFATGEINAGTCIPSFIAHIIQWIFALAGSVCIIMIIFGGYEITLGKLSGSGGESGRNRIRWAIIGFVMSATSFYIMDFIIAAIAG